MNVAVNFSKCLSKEKRVRMPVVFLCRKTAGGALALDSQVSLHTQICTRQTYSSALYVYIIRHS